MRFSLCTKQLKKPTKNNAVLKYRKVIFILFISASFFFPLSAHAKKKRVYKSPSGCRAVIYSDATNLKRFYGKNPNMRVQPASTTKIMTALLVLENLSLNDNVTVSPRATYVVPSKIDVRPGEQYKVRDLLFALILNSANDASIVLAEAVAGSEWKFVQMMNARARQLGAVHTKFANSNGLPTKRIVQYTTAFDMYLIFKEALRHTFFRQAIKLKYKTIQSSTGRQIALKSHNKMLFMGWKKSIYGKTGYTRSAGACFVGALQQGVDTHIIGVFDCNGRWDVIKNVVTRYGGVAL